MYNHFFVCLTVISLGHQGSLQCPLRGSLSASSLRSNLNLIHGIPAETSAAASQICGKRLTNLGDCCIRYRLNFIHGFPTEILLAVSKIRGKGLKDSVDTYTRYSLNLIHDVSTEILLAMIQICRESLTNLGDSCTRYKKVRLTQSLWIRQSHNNTNSLKDVSLPTT